MFRFFGLTIIRAIFSCSFCWTIEIWLIIFLATGKSGKVFQGTYFFKVKSLLSATLVCFWSIQLSECNKHFFFPYCRLTGTSIHHSSHAINRCWQCLFDYLECEFFFASTMKSNAEFIGRPTTLKCFIFSVLVFRRELRNPPWNDRAQSRQTVRFRKSSLRAFSRGKFKSCFPTGG